VIRTGGREENARVGRWSAAVCLVVFGAATACSASHDPSTSGHDEPVDGVSSNVGRGKVGLQLTVGSGVVIDTVTYRLTGPNSFTEAGTINVANSVMVSTLLGGLPAGSGYGVSLTGTSLNGAFTCAGESAPFSISSDQTTPVSVTLSCSQAPPDAGAVSVEVTASECPVIEQITVLPANTSVGGTMSLLGAARGLDPNALAYSWTANAGSIANASSADATFTCTATGPAIITLAVSDGSDAAGCAASQTVTVTCTE
jgi:hypothetical protein